MCVRDYVLALIIFRHPSGGIDESVRDIPRRFAAVVDDTHSRGLDTAACVSSGAVVAVLQIDHGVRDLSVAAVPLHPSGEVYDGIEEALEEDHV